MGGTRLLLCLVPLLVLLGQIRAATPVTRCIHLPGFVGGSKAEEQRDTILKELVSIWRQGGGWYPRRQTQQQEQQIQAVVGKLFGGLRSLGLLSSRSAPLAALNTPLDRHRLSGFLYNISMYLQAMGAEIEEKPAPLGEDQFWEKILYTFLQSEGEASFGPREGRVPPRPSFRLQDLFLSLRGSPHWDGLLGLVQSILYLSERQPQRPVLAFVTQNWKSISALLEAALQALLSGTYGQASAGLQGFICVLKGHRDCGFNTGWLQQVLSFLETRNWKPVVDLHPPTAAGAQKDGGSLSAGRLKPFSLPPEALKEVGGPATLNRTSDSEDLSSVRALLQALNRPNAAERAMQFAERNPALLRGLDDFRRGLLHRLGSTVYANLRRKVSRVTMVLLDDVSSVVGVPPSSAQARCTMGDLRHLILWGIRHNLTWNAQALGFTPQGPPSRPPFMSCPEPSGPPVTAAGPAPHRSRLTDPRSSSAHHPDHQAALDPAAEILEAACNESIPGLTGVSNFTVFLYCNLFGGSDASLDLEAGRAGQDLHATCSDAAWYLSAAEDDFLWVHVCSEFFAHEFNNTVCANASFWLQQAHQAAVSKDYHYFNQSSIDELCVQLSGDAAGVSGLHADQDCLALLSSHTLSAQDFRRCFLPNNSALIASLCGSSPAPQAGTWASEYCARLLNATLERCGLESWEPERLERCLRSPGLRDMLCGNGSRFQQLLPRLCADPAAGDKPDGRCALQVFFDALPAPYAFDTSRLCSSPAPLLLGALQSLGRCGGPRDERAGWLATVGYVLRVLDFVVGLSAGLDEGEREVRQGLGQAILLSSLTDNSSFWSTLRPNASLSVLHTVAVFLRREQSLAVKEDLLSCFSPVLWDLIQRDDNSSALRFLMQEYLRMPGESIRTVVMSAEKEAVKRFLSHVHQSWDRLQVELDQASPREQQAMETMTAAFIHKFPRVTPDLFVDLSQFIPFMSVDDIMGFPASLMVNDSVLLAIREHGHELRSQQKQAFVQRLLQSSMAGEVPAWPPYFLSSALPLLPHLPLCHFQQLTGPQLGPLLELLGNSSLDATRGHHVLRTAFSKRKNFSADSVSRLGALVCFLDPEELRPFLLPDRPSPALWQQLARCVTEGRVSSRGRLSYWLQLALGPVNASALAPSELASLSGLLPQLGHSFLASLSSRDLLHLLAQPDTPPFSPAQAFQVLARMAQDTNLSMADVCGLAPLLSGLSPAFLSSVRAAGPEDEGDCRCWRPLLPGLPPAHRAMFLTAVLEGLDEAAGNASLLLHCTLPFVPLKTLDETLDGGAVLSRLPLYRDLPWSQQQAQLLFRKVQQAVNVTMETVQTLGRIAGGMNCDWLALWANETGFSELLAFLSKLPGRLRPALRKCVVEALKTRPETELDPAFAALLPVRMLENLSNASLAAVLEHVLLNFHEFLLLPGHKQTALAEKAVEVLGLSGSSLDRLGPLLPFLDRDSFVLVDRGALKLRLEELRSFCLPSDRVRDVAAALTEEAVLGDPAAWSVGDVELAGRLIFTLSLKQIRSLPLDDLGSELVEQLLYSQQVWEGSEVGRMCGTPPDFRDKIFTFIHRVIKGGRRRRRRDPVPSCADVRGTFPSAWTPSQLQHMAETELQRCVDFMGQDAGLGPDQRRTLWSKLRQAYRPVRDVRPEQLLELGSIATEMSERELQAVDASDLGVVAQLGRLAGWSPRKMRAAALGVLRRRGRKPEQLGALELAALGHLVCGLSPAELGRVDPHNLSLAALFLREAALPCSEEQMEVLTSGLSSPRAFGPVSDWGADVFTEIGTLAAGLEDLLLSSLVKEQIQGLTPAAIALLPPRKLAVVLGAAQLSWFSSEQAAAVTRDQWAELDGQQRQALSLALYEGDVIVAHRGRNHAPPALVS
ncbi:stereocilin-like [Denticeps clupeoides]|uniref:stereocilin-like n=1 Tax=Denticeps clupeoides TaxID=299321 RepID=UPI0010A2C077|nr:stereocilin-like [Denticeps clupeoides]